MSKRRKLILLDPGHGGWVKGPNGPIYATPGKRAHHPGERFHNEGWFYEGVWNRALCREIVKILRGLRIPYLILSSEGYDTPLRKRVEIANQYHENYADCLYVSLHANWFSDPQVSGYQVHTSPGQTKSDLIAEYQWYLAKELLGDFFHFRADWSDKIDPDPDYEDNFFVLRKTTCPAYLAEHGFMSNLQDAKKLMNDEVIRLFAQSHVETAIAHNYG
jgi:N-acetylmuramoyl-L-alanine amidase